MAEFSCKTRKAKETAQLFQITRRNNSEKDQDTRTTTSPETLEIIMKTGGATFQSVIMAAYEIGLLAICGIKKQLFTGYEKYVYICDPSFMCSGK